VDFAGFLDDIQQQFLLDVARQHGTVEEYEMAATRQATRATVVLLPTEKWRPNANPSDPGCKVRSRATTDNVNIAREPTDLRQVKK
jgi:hypothetical protein